MKNTPLAFLVVGLVLGVLVVMQFKGEVPISERFFGDEIQLKDDLIQEYANEQAYLQSRIVNLRKQVEEAETELENQTESVNLDLLDDLKARVGLSEISGAGVEIVLDDGKGAIREGAEVTDQYLVQAADLRDIINLLNAASAEAISINGQRVISTSTVFSVGSSILVNNSQTAPPFSIQAIGDSELILQRLKNRGLLDSIYTRSEKGEIRFEIVEKNNLRAPIFNGALKTDFLNLVEQ